MLKYLLLSNLVILGFFSIAQDTTWVQTFTFDSIITRRANFEFPAELNDKRFEKVLMYYKLKCSPLTTADSYDCGEWDASTYTRVFEHTGEMDSVRVDGNKYLANLATPSNIEYSPLPYSYSDSYIRNENNRSGSSAVTQVLNAPTGTTAFPFDVTNNGGRYQMLLSASELNTAGIVAGDIQSLTLYLNSFTTNGELRNPKISLKSTTNSTLTSFHKTGFTEVYNASHWTGGSNGDLVAGQNELLFYQPFTWNGTDNIIIEFYFENTLDAVNSLLFDGESIGTSTAMYYNSMNGCMKFDATNHAMLELSDFTMGTEMTISFWSKGNGAAGNTTSILEAYGVDGNRVVNIHMPWSDNTMYFDAGEGTGWDRISKPMTAAEIDNNWNHWAFVKNSTTGDMKIYKNGVLWHSGTNLTQEIGYIHRLVLGSNWDQAYNWKGKIDDFQIFDVALPQATIQTWMNQKPDATHPNWSDLLVYYDFDNKTWAEDLSQNDNLLMPSEQGMFDFTEYTNTGIKTATERPSIGLGQGIVTGSNVVSQETEIRLKEPTVIFELQPIDRHFAIVNSEVGILSGNETVYNNMQQVVFQTPFTGSTTLTNDSITFYKEPFEILNDIEIGRFITPYGISFDLGPNGFYWIYDVTDYQQYLKNIVDLAAGDNRELLDLKFAFIEGIPPRDVHNREPIWANYKSYRYADLDNDVVLQEIPVALSDTSEMFKIKSRMTGHGHYGSVNCCEWDKKDHMISLDGVQRFAWDIFEETACGDNPNVGQGGTWPYAREGWCPGDQVKEYDHEMTPFVTPGDTVLIDYDIENVPIGDPAQGNGDYWIAMDLISYSAPNFQHDAAIVDILNPNNWEYYSKWNPSCSNPRIILQNTGALPLTKCNIRCWVTYGVWLEYEWTGNLAFLEKEIVEIPVTDLQWWRDYSGTLEFHAQVYGVEGSPDLDEYSNNNHKKVKFDAPETINGPFFVWLTTNNKASENNYRLQDASGNILFQRTTLTNNTQYKDTFDLAPGCYSIIIEDTDNDGLSFWYSSQSEGETAGSMRIRLVGGSYVEFFEVDFGNYHRYDFSVGFSLGEEELQLDHEITIFPNPTNGQCSIELNGYVSNKADLIIYDFTGKSVHNESMSANGTFAEAHPDLSHLSSGRYIVKIVTNDRVYTKEFIIN